MQPKRHFENFLTAYMEYCSNVSAPKQYMYWSALSVVSAAIERKLWCTTGKLFWFPNIYTCIVGEKSTRKSSGCAIAVNLYRELPGREQPITQINSGSYNQYMTLQSNKNNINISGT